MAPEPDSFVFTLGDEALDQCVGFLRPLLESREAYWIPVNNLVYKYKPDIVGGLQPACQGIQTSSHPIWADTIVKIIGT